MKLAIVSLLFCILNCAPVLFQKTNGPTHGAIFTENKFPGEFNQSNDVPAAKKAEGCINQVLYIVMWGDAAAGSIALENKITRIAIIDHSTISVLGLYSRYCTIIKGE